MNQNLAMLASCLIAFVVTAGSGYWLVPVLHKLKFGQTILDIGPKWHKKKQGTPTMGGIMIILGVMIAALAGYLLLSRVEGFSGRPDKMLMRSRMTCGLLLAFSLGLVGFLDDYLKVVKKQNEGLNEKQKMGLQILCAVTYIVLMILSGWRNTVLYFPFIGNWDIGIFFYPFALFAIISIANAVNFTDGLDGLLSSVTLIVCVAYIIICKMLSMAEMSVLASAMAGGCLGFLVWNFYPAKCFMGDTGSLFISGIVSALMFGTDMPVLILFIGVIYVMEVGSVLIQRYYFKLTHGKRIFRMSPIHHHFEMGGMSELQIVGMFTLITVIGCAIGVLAVYLKIH